MASGMYDFAEKKKRASAHPGVSLALRCLRTRGIRNSGYSFGAFGVIHGRCVSQAERPAKRTLFEDRPGSESEPEPEPEPEPQNLRAVAVAPFIQILNNEGALANIQEHVTPSLEAKFETVRRGDANFKVYRAIAQEISEILGVVGTDDISTASIFLSSFKERAEKTTKALAEIERESIIEDLKAGRISVMKRCEDALAGLLAVLKKKYEAKKKELAAARDQDLVLLENTFRAEHPVRTWGLAGA